MLVNKSKSQQQPISDMSNTVKFIENKSLNKIIWFVFDSECEADGYCQVGLKLKVCVKGVMKDVHYVDIVQDLSYMIEILTEALRISEKNNPHDNATYQRGIDALSNWEFNNKARFDTPQLLTPLGFNALKN
ncbi:MULTISPECIES: hypothetical protein [Pseudoalteromonas]|uniref:hypothetical protein n=1 Tax=Pseudoalteromonas TaxID=53246 RepID=UPI0015824FEF|nr:MULTISPECIES: hypothetical protein [Pseudoalteromonas]MDI4654568.1 hypothetical protein [Pseudoalteromonas shioyasakiensis]NUJ40163.1 hypothetical protein [Pseudoalteromonas sp. 0303]